MNVLDKIIFAFSPEAGLNRMRHRLAGEVVSRKYEAAVQGGRRNGGWWRPKTTAAQEVATAANQLSSTAQELCRNSPLAHRIKMVWASNMVGTGIRPQVINGSVTARKKMSEAISKWQHSTFCDFDNQYNFYGLQWLWAAIIVESGGVLIRKHVDNSNPLIPLRLQTLEQSMLDSTVNTPNTAGNIVFSGIEFTKAGQRVGYWVKNIDFTTGQINGDQSIFLKHGEECIHLYRKERAYQHLGVSWLTQSATTIKKYDTLVDAKLMQDQIAACLGLIISGGSKSVGVGDKNEPIEEVEPGMVHYTDSDAKVTTIIPPSSQGSQAFMETVRADIAIGAGLAHTQVTGDYSKLNFASGRMSKIEFFQTLDYCQKQMLEPGLNIVFEWFKKLHSIKTNISIKNDFDVIWVYPPRAVVQPKEELDVLLRKVRNGLESPSAACMSFGNDLTDVVGQWKLDKDTFGELPFDIDPSLFSAAGNQLNTDDAASENAANSNTDGGNKDE